MGKEESAGFGGESWPGRFPVTSGRVSSPPRTSVLTHEGLEEVTPRSVLSQETQTHERAFTSKRRALGPALRHPNGLKGQAGRTGFCKGQVGEEGLRSERAQCPGPGSLGGWQGAALRPVPADQLGFPADPSWVSLVAQTPPGKGRGSGPTCTSSPGVAWGRGRNMGPKQGDGLMASPAPWRAGRDSCTHCPV